MDQQLHTETSAFRCPRTKLFAFMSKAGKSFYKKGNI
jgi:hypothetical protein